MAAEGGSPLRSVVSQEAWGRFQDERKRRLGERAEAERCATERARARDAEDSLKADRKKREAAELQAFLLQQIEDKKSSGGRAPLEDGAATGFMGADAGAPLTSPKKFAQRQAPGTQQEFKGLVAQQALERHRAEMAAMEAEKAKNDDFLSQRLQELNAKEDMLREKKKKDAADMQACLLRQMEEKRGLGGQPAARAGVERAPARAPGGDQGWKFPMMPSEADAISKSSTKGEKMAAYRSELLNQINMNKLMEQEEKEASRAQGEADRRAMEEHMLAGGKVQNRATHPKSQVFNYDD